MRARWRLAEDVQPITNLRRADLAQIAVNVLDQVSEIDAIHARQANRHPMLIERVIPVMLVPVMMLVVMVVRVVVIVPVMIIMVIAPLVIMATVVIMIMLIIDRKSVV